ncbi:MAG: hypothetical protein M1840_001413 [Geoglossum simile]|nr:MAG: hypothetical protein M1840_001413 [Geoglossum simile]
MALLQASQAWSSTPLQFSLCELSLAGCLDSRFARPPDLDNEIHPIFQFENFDIPRDQYETLTPALRFASLLITSEACMDWWVAACSGAVSMAMSLPVPMEQRSALNRYSVLYPVEPVTREHIAATKDALLDLANNISFRFWVPPNPGGYIFGTQHRSSRGTQQVGLSRGFQDFIASGGGIADASQSQQLRFQFFFAINAVHEVAHAFYDNSRTPRGHRRTSTREQPQRRPHREEPYFYPEVRRGVFDPELGACWERHVFGCKIQPNLEGPIRSTPPECCFYGLHRFSGDGDGGHSGAIPMGYVSAMMQKSRWDKVARLGASALRCPTPAIYAMDCSVGP